MIKEFTFRGKRYIWRPGKLAETIFNAVTIGAIIALYGYVFSAVVLGILGIYM